MFYVKNVPNWERVLRIIAGVVVAVLAVSYWHGVPGIVVAIAAIGTVISGLVGFCPACALVGRRLDKQVQP